MSPRRALVLAGALAAACASPEGGAPHVSDAPGAEVVAAGAGDLAVAPRAVDPARAVPSSAPGGTARRRAPRERLAPGARMDHMGLPADEPAVAPTARVVVVASTRCQKLANQLAYLRDLERAYAARSVGFLYVYADPRDDAGEVEAFHRTSGLSGRQHVDGEQRLLRRLDADRAGEAFVIDASETLRYRGAIELTLADRRREPLLAQALEAVLAGRPVATPVAPVPGCAFPR